MPPIHIGDSTHHHDQAMTPVSLSTISVITASCAAEAGMELGLHCTLGRERVIRKSGILQAYGADVEVMVLCMAA
jgi:hypothetical protein